MKETLSSPLAILHDTISYSKYLLWKYQICHNILKWLKSGAMIFNDPPTLHLSSKDDDEEDPCCVYKMNLNLISGVRTNNLNASGSQNPIGR